MHAQWADVVATIAGIKLALKYNWLTHAELENVMPVQFNTALNQLVHDGSLHLLVAWRAVPCARPRTMKRSELV
eukprot:SAG31_NODE_4869_length_2877_cov_1.648446_4_plen_74_part_00